MNIFQTLDSTQELEHSIAMHNLIEDLPLKQRITAEKHPEWPSSTARKRSNTKTHPKLTNISHPSQTTYLKCGPNRRNTKTFAWTKWTTTWERNAPLLAWPKLNQNGRTSNPPSCAKQDDRKAYPSRQSKICIYTPTLKDCISSTTIFHSFGNIPWGTTIRDWKSICRIIR